MMIIIIGTWSRSSHVFSADAGSLLSRNPESFSATRRAGGQAGLVWASQPSSVQPPVKTSTQTQSRARHLLLSTLRLSLESRMGRKCGNFLINRLTGDSLPHMSNVTLGNPEKLYARPAILYGGYKIRGWGFQDTHQDLITLGWLLKTHDHPAPIFYALIHFGDLLTDQVTCHITLSWFIECPLFSLQSLFNKLITRFILHRLELYLFTINDR